jgi:DNA-binding beta-propeller fold protein YncE
MGQDPSMNFLQVAILRWYQHGSNRGTFAVGSGPRAMAFDGKNMWVANTTSNDVTKLRARDGANLGTFSVGSAPENVAFDGANIWVSNSASDTVSKL